MLENEKRHILDEEMVKTFFIFNFISISLKTIILFFEVEITNHLRKNRYLIFLPLRKHFIFIVYFIINLCTEYFI